MRNFAVVAAFFATCLFAACEQPEEPTKQPQTETPRATTEEEVNRTVVVPPTVSEDVPSEPHMGEPPSPSQPQPVYPDGKPEHIVPHELSPSRSGLSDFLLKGAGHKNLEPLPPIYRIRQKDGHDSIVSIEAPRGSNKPDCALIWHGGHQAQVPWLDPQVMKLSVRVLNRGCIFVGMAMPENGPNVFEEKSTTNLHKDFAADRSAEFEPFSYFVSPVEAVIDHLEAMGVDKIAMAGLSGGGWTTSVVAAMDERISWSRSIAGSMPFELEEVDIPNPKELNLTSIKGDFEQSDPLFWKDVASYWDIYKMSGSSDRDARLLYFANDKCCFPGSLAPALRDGLARIDAHVIVDVDWQSQGHGLSDSAIDWVMQGLFDRR